MHFRLVGNSHHARDGKTYERGDIIESDDDLIKKFPNKFERANVDEATSVLEDDAPDLDDEDLEEDDLDDADEDEE
jgi:hypothetical protein